MMSMEEINAAQASDLCKACGLCCTGHLFIWVKLKPSELDPAEKLGLHVFRSDPSQRGFSQPCPLWKGTCTIYHSPHYPRGCRAYQCKLLKEVIAEKVPFSEALQVVDRAKEMIELLEPMLPVLPNKGFRERLVEHIEHPAETARWEKTYLAFRTKADELLRYFEGYFGVKDLIEQSKQENWEE